jgi:diguanylate cyclase (GGDEF)-like protein/PAS domain S-box-containing protein
MGKSNPRQEQYEQLCQENDLLKQTCNNLEMTIQSMEVAISNAGRQQLQAEINGLELEQIFSAAKDPIWAVRDDGIVIRANAAMLKLLNKENSEVLGQPCSELLDYGLCQGSNSPLSSLSDAQEHEFDVQLGDEFYNIATAPLTTIIGTSALVAHFRNITARKVAEQQLEQLNRKLKEMANIDGLTQIANRRHFDATLDNEWQRQQRTRKPLSLVMIDIDFFKKYNDHYGHYAGDECLIKVATTLKNTLNRPADLVARYGGEEFVLLLPEIPLEGAKEVAERVAAAIANLKLPHCESTVSDFITISQGIACVIPSEEMTSIDLINQADKLLYQSKEEGRNRFTAN